MKTLRAVQTVAGFLAVVVLSILTWAITMLGYCQIPRGIYDDTLQFKLLDKHFTATGKSIKQIDLRPEDLDGNALATDLQIVQQLRSPHEEFKGIYSGNEK